MNAFIAQSELTRAESRMLVSVGKNFTSSQDSKPMLAIKQDAMTGAYKLTYGRVPIRKMLFMDCFTHERFTMDMYIEKRAHVLQVYNDLGYFKNCKTPEDISKKEDQLLYCGHTLFSFLLPNDFEYYIENNISPYNKNNELITNDSIDKKPQPVYITRGVLVSGTLNKTAMGSSSASLIHHLWKDYGEEKACWFVSMYQICINFWFQHHGFSVGLEDCIPGNSETVTSEMQRRFMQAHAVMNVETDPEIRESRVVTQLNNATAVGLTHAQKALLPTNNLVSMIRSGAKGDYINITQVTGLVGQQYISAQRIPKTYGNRTLPHFVKQGVRVKDSDAYNAGASVKDITRLFQSRGFVTSSFYKGLNPVEFFFHAAGGREGLNDTACKTADTGYAQRKLIKMMEDCRVSYTGVVTNSIDNIIQFDYGGDNMDASHLINVSKDDTSKTYSFIHAEHVVEKLCTQLENACIV